MTTHLSFNALDDRSLIDAAKRLATEERRATAALLRALIEVDSRALYHGEGCSSMFAWCTQVLHLSEGGAYNRIEAARAARKYPAILNLLEHSAITLTAVRLLAPHLTAENHVAALTSARHKTKREVEGLVAALAPKPDAPTVVRKLPVQPVATVPLYALEPSAPQPARPAGFAPAVPAKVPQEVPATPAAPARVASLAPDRYRIQITVSQATHEKFRRARLFCDTRCHLVTLPRSSTARSRCSSSTWSGGGTPRRLAREPLKRPPGARVMFPLPCGVRYGSAMTDAARSSVLRVAAPRWPFSSSTMSNRMRWAAHQRSRTSSSGAGHTTATRHGSSSDLSSRGSREGSGLFLNMSDERAAQLVI